MHTVFRLEAFFLFKASLSVSLFPLLYFSSLFFTFAVFSFCFSPPPWGSIFSFLFPLFSSFFLFASFLNSSSIFREERVCRREVVTARRNLKVSLSLFISLKSKNCFPKNRVISIRSLLQGAWCSVLLVVGSRHPPVPRHRHRHAPSTQRALMGPGWHWALRAACPRHLPVLFPCAISLCCLPAPHTGSKARLDGELCRSLAPVALPSPMAAPGSSSVQFDCSDVAGAAARVSSDHLKHGTAISPRDPRRVLPVRVGEETDGWGWGERLSFVWKGSVGRPKSSPWEEPGCAAEPALPRGQAWSPFAMERHRAQTRWRWGW